VNLAEATERAKILTQSNDMDPVALAAIGLVMKAWSTPRPEPSPVSELVFRDGATFGSFTVSWWTHSVLVMNCATRLQKRMMNMRAAPYGSYPIGEDAGRRTPKYEQIRDDLAMAIHRGDYRPGDALPSQRELSTSYGVTLMTLRQALQVLSEEGLVVQQPGRGTFVALRRASPPCQSPRDVADQLRSQGVEVKTSIIRLGNRRPSATVRAALNLPDGRGALCIERLQVMGGMPVIHQISWVTEPYAKRIRGADFTEIAVHEALAEHVSQTIPRSVEAIRPELVTAGVARHLHIQVGSPVFLSERVTLGVNDRPLIFDRTTMLGKKMVIRAEYNKHGTSWSWGLGEPPLGLVE
jgi:GntR family transcriptional regulator